MEIERYYINICKENFILKTMPKRNKSKDNPYTLEYDEQNDAYTVKFVDNKRVIHKIEISVEIYKAFDKFELEDISQIHKLEVILNIQNSLMKL